MAGGTKYDDDEGIHDINVTPFVDVVLVLLVIFMVTAGFIVNRGIKVQMPEAATTEKLAAQKTFNIVVGVEGQILLDGEPADTVILGQRGSEAMARGDKVVAMISADKGVTYSKVVAVMDALRLVGISEFALQLEPVPVDSRGK